MLACAASAEEENRTKEGATIASMPLLFIQNEGQYDDNVSYQTQSSPEQVITVFENGIEFSQSPQNNGTAPEPVFMMLDGANKDTRIISLNQVNGTANFMYGPDPSTWVKDVKVSTAVEYSEVYPGINLTLSGKEGVLKSEFTLKPGADPSAIVLQYQGQDSLVLNQTTGDLIIRTAGREIYDEAPYAFQEINGSRSQVNCSYTIGENNTVTFTVGSYDPTKILVIDPVMRYSLYFGGNGRDQGNSIAVDNSGFAYFIGTTWSDHLKYFKSQNQSQMSAQGLAPGSVQPYFGGGDKDAFVIKINPDGTELIYITYIGGSGTDEGTGLVIDKEGFTYITGGTNSRDLPVKNAFRDKNSGGYDVWVMKLDPNGKDVSFSTYLGGTDDDFGYAIAIDSTKNVFVTGQTKSWNFPVVNRYQLSPFGGLGDAFITKLTPEGKAIVYSNFIGGSAYETGSAVSVDPNGYACIVGQTESPNFPTIKPYQSNFKGSFDAFVTKFDPEGKYPAAYSTYLGGKDWDDGKGIITYPDGRLTIVGSTKSPDFPTINPIQPSIQGVQDGFITTLNPDGSALNQSTFFGGYLVDSISSAARDDTGNIFIAGTTDSLDLPVIRAYQSRLGGKSDVMLTKFNPDISQIVYCTYLGGSDIDEGRSLAVTGEGEVYLTGYTTSINFPKVWPYQQNFGDGDRDAFVAVLSEHDMIPVTDFVGVPTEGEAPLTVQFTDKSLGIPTSWLWEFGDNTTSTEKNPQHIYQNPGVYTVSLTASNIVSSQKKTKENYITVREPVRPPVADFNGNPTTGIVPLSVTFTDLTTNKPTAWSWVFGDGGLSQEQNPVHVYTTAGTYTVNLTASNKAGSSSKEKPQYITAKPDVIKPIADFIADPTSGMIPLTVRFTDTSKNNPTSWLWTFGDGTSATEQNPVHVYTREGVYSVTLNATNVAGTDSITKPELIHANPSVIKPVADFSANPTNGFAPLQVTFTDLSRNNPTAWRWDFGDKTTATDKNPVHLYTQPGTYSVTLNVSNSAGSDQITKPNLISVNKTTPPPVADFNAVPTSGVAPLSVQFTDCSTGEPNRWLWDFGDNTKSEEKNPAHIFKKEGVYSVTLTVWNSAGMSQKTKPNFITVSPAVLRPVADFTGAPTNGLAPLKVSFVDLSLNAPTSWSWTFGDGKTSVEQNPTHTYEAPGRYTVELVVTNTAGTDRKVMPDYINVTKPGCPPDAQFRGSPTTGTVPLTVSFTDLSGGNPDRWAWNFGDKGTSEKQHPEHTYQAPGEYTITLTVSNEFGDSTEVREKYIRVLDKPIPLKAAFMGEPTSGTAPLSVRFTDLSTGTPTSWLWNFGDNGSSTDKNPTYIYTEPGDYTVILTVMRGEDRSTEIRYQYIHVSPAGKPPVPDFVASPLSGKVPLSVYFTDLSLNDPTAWRWDFGDGESSVEQNPTHIYSTPGTYSVCLEASNSFGSARACKDKLITVNEVPKEPAQFYGHVTVNGEQAPCDTVVEARGTGVQTGISGNPVVNEEVGNYGIPEPLIVQGTIRNNDPVTFWVKAPGSTEFVQAECYDVYGSAVWTSSYPFRGGQKTRLDLRIGGEGIPPMPVLPHEFFGEISYNGMPLPIGSTLMVKGENIIEGHKGNPLPITSPGVFGFENMQTLVAQGDLKKGQSLTFLITPAGSNEPIEAEVRDIEAGGDWMTSYPYSEGALTRLSIKAGGGGGNPPVPTLPMTISGAVTIQDKPAGTGSLITADGPGVRVGIDENPVQVSAPGKFGDNTKLTVQGDIAKGSPLMFTIYDAETGQEHGAEIMDPVSGQWIQTFPFESGSDVILDLRSSGKIPGEKPVPGEQPRPRSPEPGMNSS
jgi:PKD repeat protein